MDYFINLVPIKIETALKKKTEASTIQMYFMPREIFVLDISNLEFIMPPFPSGRKQNPEVMTGSAEEKVSLEVPRRS